jgi:putative phosphoribosyl transferase
MEPFVDRAEAGRRLAAWLMPFQAGDVVVLGVPRGGVPVAFEVASALGAPLDIVVVRKLGLPYEPEIAMGAIGEDGVRVLDPDVLRSAAITTEELAAVEERERGELDRRVRRFRGDVPRVALAGRTAIVVDDGIATGYTARAACQVARMQGATQVILAAPVGSPEAVADLQDQVDMLVCPEVPETFRAVGQWYYDFAPTSDDDVVVLLRRTRERGHAAEPSALGADGPVRDEQVAVAAGTAALTGHLTIPEKPAGLVILGRPGAGNRHSPRDRFVAWMLNRAGLGTLLVDLFESGESAGRSPVLHIETPARRLRAVTEWARARPDLADLRIGYLGTGTGNGTGSAAALWAAACPGADIAAVIAWGGRPDLAAPRLRAVRAPTLFIVGELDRTVLELNRRTGAHGGHDSKIAVVPGATSLYEEPGGLAEAARIAGAWFTHHLSRTAADPNSAEAATPRGHLVHQRQPAPRDQGAPVRHGPGLPEGGRGG